MRIEIIPAPDHMPEHYRDYLEGYRAVRLMDDENQVRGELVWRLACRSKAIFEIKEFGFFRAEDRRHGWGTKLLETAFHDMRAFVEPFGYSSWRVYLFCEEKNLVGRAFYEARGFHVEALLKDFYGVGEHGLLYTQLLAERASS
jgi:ribosomal protein S18 acetylase RimI-like enzyme